MICSRSAHLGALLLALTSLVPMAASRPQGSGVVEASAKRGPKVLDPAACGIGERVSRLPWRDLRGRPGRLGEVGARRGQVVALTDTSCPLAQKLAPSLARLQERCRDAGLDLVLLNTGEEEQRADAVRWVERHGIEVPYVMDSTGELARALDARTTTDVFLLDAEGRRVYRGAIDDRVGIGYTREVARETYLEAAIDALVEGEPVPVPATWAPGCVLDLEEPEGASELTWHGRVSRIVERRCGSCHVEGGVAPFPLSARADLKRRKGMLRFVLEERLMPPWGAEPGSGPWRNDHSLPEAERADLLAWLEAGLPEGDPSSAAPPSAAHDSTEWLIGTPDLVVEIPREQSVPAEGYLDYIEFVVPLGLTEDRWVKAVEIQPTAPQVVHHVVVHVLTEGGLRESRNTLPGFMAGYVPGNRSNVLPPGFARKLPAGSRLFFQLHYTPNGTPAVDRTRLALVFQDEAPEHEVKSIGVANKNFEIPAGEAHFAVEAGLKLPKSIGVLSLMPHMHLRGEAFRITADPPKRAALTLLDVARYDFNWQFAYRFEDPVILPEGTRLGVTGWFDNSDANPANPNPSKDVRWGDQTYEEMMIGYVEYYVL